ncbi:MAG: hypothetical protein KAR44_14800 [Candidatus Aegiribacteria sp.]|nr:hypothetical protein [Candidatus Aegiribacteria sp.]
MCNKNKRNSSFYADSRKKDGLRSACKKCYGKRYPWRKNKNSKAVWRKYALSEKGIMTGLLSNAKDRARKKNIEYSIDREWLRSKLRLGICELSGIKFKKGSIGPFRANPFGPSIDKINPRGGYTKNNCRVICFCINMARSDWGDDVLIKMAKAILKAKGIT